MKRPSVIALTFVIVAPLSCASLIVRPHDSAGKKATKVGARVALGIATVSTSELVIRHLEVQAERERSRVDVRHARLEYERAQRQAEAQHLSQLRDCIGKNRALAASDPQNRAVHIAAQDGCSSELRDYLTRKREIEEADRRLEQQLRQEQAYQQAMQDETRRRFGQALSQSFGQVGPQLMLQGARDYSAPYQPTPTPPTYDTDCTSHSWDDGWSCTTRQR
jgi:hypothetical protein